VQRIAASDATALIVGETGTGKERIARAIHGASPRGRERLVAVNCAAIPAELLESELFGYTRGSFTGAARDRAGLFEEADQGSLFLDEIGEMRLSLQAKLTRAIEERSIRRLGESKERQVNVRLIAATHRDLEAMVRAESFREDLWYRLNVAVIRVPALRDRREDVELLAAHFLREIASAAPGRGSGGFTEAAREVLSRYDWPGNVRQLRAVVERASIEAGAEPVDLGHLPPEVVSDRVPGLSPGLTNMKWQEAIELGRRETGRQYLQAILKRYGGRVADAAAHAGVERESFYRLLRKHGVNPDGSAGDPEE
jgi:two-component system response regulator HydG